jgi:hypothetical protein
MKSRATKNIIKMTSSSPVNVPVERIDCADARWMRMNESVVDGSMLLFYVGIGTALYDWKAQLRLAIHQTGKAKRC